MSRKKKSAPAQNEVPPSHDWRTTDLDEINRRRQRAVEEKFVIENTDARHPLFSNFRVRSGSGRTYSVEVRGTTMGEIVCTCVDFRTNQLGTCKHAEAVRMRLARRHAREWRAAAETGSTRLDVLPDGERGTLRLSKPGQVKVPAALREWFDEEGGLLPGDPTEAAGHLSGALARRFPQLRVSQEVEPWLEARRRVEERLALRREYELKVQSGEWPPHETRVPLFPYQRDGMLHLAFTERALLADEMGLGKTIQAIAACALLARMGKVKRVLVVTPASLKGEWEEQIRRFSDLTCHLVFGSHHRRTAWLRDLAESKEPGPFFVVMNYEQVVPSIPEINEWLAPDVVILDEAQRIKNWNTRTARRIKELHSRYAFILTGTPLENRIDELRSLVDFLDPALLGPLFRFNRDFYAFDDRGRPTGYRQLDRLHDRVKPVLLRRRKAEVEAQLPPRTDRNHLVTMSDRQRRAYGAHEQEVMILASKAERRPLTEKELKRLMIELAMMRMICDTNHILDPKDRECPKLVELGRIIEDCAANDAQLIIFSEWQGMLDLVRDHCREKEIDFAWHTGSVPQQKRRVEINRFKSDPKCRVFLSTDAGATGLNLQNATVVVNCDLPWNPTRLEQRIARAWRKHQTRPVTVVNLITENSIEQRMLETLARKRTIAESVLDSPGAITEVSIRSGRKAMVEQIRSLMSAGSAAAAAPESATRPAAEPARDPVAEVAREARRRLGRGLLRVEERQPLDRSAPVLVFVVEQKSDRLEAEIRGLAEKRFGEAGGVGPGLAAPRIELLDRATHEAIQRLIDAGLLRSTHQHLRSVLEDAPVSRPRLTPAQELAMKTWREKAERALRMARVLATSGFPEEARAPLRTAVLACACGRAITEALPEPTALKDLAEAVWTAHVGEVSEVVAGLEAGGSSDAEFGRWLDLTAALISNPGSVGQ